MGEQLELAIGVHAARDRAEHARRADACDDYAEQCERIGPVYLMCKQQAAYHRRKATT